MGFLNKHPFKFGIAWIVIFPTTVSLVVKGSDQLGWIALAFVALVIPTILFTLILLAVFKQDLKELKWWHLPLGQFVLFAIALAWDKT